MNEDIFYLFTQAMDLKYEDTVEAIHDLVMFIVASNNHNAWDKVYDYLRSEAQQIIDNDNENEKRDIIEEFNTDEWGEICTKTNVCKIDEFECTLTEYVNFVIRFFNEKMLYVQHEYPQRNYVLTKIDIMYMEAIE